MQNKNYQKAIIPSHYNSGKISCWDAIIAAYGEEEAKIWAKITAFKYLWRLGKKDDILQELGKEQWYINKLIELEENTRNKQEKSTKIPQSLVTIDEINMLLNKKEDE